MIKPTIQSAYQPGKSTEFLFVAKNLQVYIVKLPSYNRFQLRNKC